MLGDRVASARKRAGLSQRQLAGAMGGRYDQTMISHVESGRSGLVGEGLSKVATALGVSIDYLFGFTDDPTPTDQLASRIGVSFSQAPNVAMIPKVAAIVGKVREEAEYDVTILERLPLPSEWLTERGINPSNCHLVSFQGDWMKPTLPDGCTILVNLDAQEYREGSIFLLQFEQQIIEDIVRYLTPVRLTLDKGIFNGQKYEDWYLKFDNIESAWPLSLYDVKRVIGEIVMVVTFL